MKSYWKGAVKAEPDFRNLLKVLRRERPSRPTLFEFFLNDTLHAALAPEIAVKASHVSYANDILRVTAYRNAGYDYAVANVPGMGFPTGEREHKHGQTISQNEGFVITDRKSFDAYQWPDPEMADYAFLDKLGEVVPKGMKLGVGGPGGVLENVTSLLGYENMCFMIADDPGLAGDVFEAVGTRLVKMYRNAVKSKSVGFIIGNDDWGFKSQTMLAPEQMRAYVFPWHKQIVEAAHEASDLAGGSGETAGRDVFGEHRAREVDGEDDVDGLSDPDRRAGLRAISGLERPAREDRRMAGGARHAALRRSERARGACRARARDDWS
jgi:uroporphyrinogen decarboxylase